VEDVMEDALVETPDGWDDVDVDSLEPGNDFVIPEAAADPAADAGADAQEEAADGGGGGGCGCRLVY
jgi:hypothetical protein